MHLGEECCFLHKGEESCGRRVGRHPRVPFVWGSLLVVVNCRADRKGGQLTISAVCSVLGFGRPFGSMCTFFTALYQSQRPVTFSLAFWGQGIYLSFSCYRKIATECKGKQLQMEKYRVGKRRGTLVRRCWPWAGRTGPEMSMALVRNILRRCTLRKGCSKSTPCLTGASSPAHRFLRRQVRWSAIPTS